jgi:uncharacterized membrane protein YesL
MSLFYNPQKSGPGVSKNEAEMKPFFKFFELFGRKFWHLTQLNVLYILLCIPIITIGPATAAMTHVMRKFVLEEPIFVYNEFFTAFKKYFKIKKTWLLGILSAGLFFAYIFYAMPYYDRLAAEYPTLESYFLMGMNMIAGAVFLTMNTYIYPQIIVLDLSMKSVFQNSARLCLLGLKRNIVTVVVFSLLIYAMILFLPFSLIVLPIAPFSWLAFLSVFNSYPVIQRFIIIPFYESTGQKNPEIPDYTENVDKNTTLFTDLGGEETPVNKKKVKTSGKLIK